MNEFHWMERMKDLCNGDVSSDIISRYIDYVGSFDPEEFKRHYHGSFTPEQEDVIIKRVNGEAYVLIHGYEHNDVWKKGDYIMLGGEFKQVPDWWDMEDLNQSETIYRPYKNYLKYNRGEL